MSLESLPPELLACIFDTFDVRRQKCDALLSVMKVSRSLYDGLLPVLYRDIDLKDNLTYACACLVLSNVPTCVIEIRLGRTFLHTCLQAVHSSRVHYRFGLR